MLSLTKEASFLGSIFKEPNKSFTLFPFFIPSFFFFPLFVLKENILTVLLHALVGFFLPSWLLQSQIFQFTLVSDSPTHALVPLFTSLPFYYSTVTR